MKKIMMTVLAVCLVLAAAGCAQKQAAVSTPAPQPAPAVPVVASADTITAASGRLYYAAGSYDLAKLQAALAVYPYPVTVAVATTNVDGSPNVAVAIPGITADGRYLKFGLAENRTKENIVQRELVVVMFYEYTPTADKAERNKGCRVVARYVGDDENTRLNTEAKAESPSLYLEIVEILPIG